ncbi:cystathionine gamma-synthase [Scopulibacillus darangshiensis]|uniref:homocysteine desulfhydrase n=1 Tax=Scopulibacillus darangshiensis TaxID=442528 RepID=A0A4R2NEP9_9BACL|nr:aminotransferase class I/II-fold pyridoxal phosphate-dependent enzyme [Scopulibacillus darangshiensis]TCP19717.1 cystathionine gamma-synthase [Scopulibacillus darangshiensis]
MHFNTRTVHFAQKDGSDKIAKTKPIYQTSAFSFKSLEDLESFYSGEKSFLYTRVGNPNTQELGMAVASLEGAPAGIATSSGMSAILVALLVVLKSGDHVIACDDLYGGTYQLLFEELENCGIEATMVPFADQTAVENAITENTKVIFTETLSNPLLRVEDIEGIVEIARRHGLLTIMDNTFATPYLIQPYSVGVNLVVHSATKYIGGHSDVTAGIVAGDSDLVGRARDRAVNMGANLGPFDGWLACRGLKTLSIRMQRHAENAKRLADFFKERSDINAVYYPENLSEKGNGAIVTVELNQNRVELSTFFKSLSWIKIVATLAGVETSVSHPATTSHRALPKDLCDKLGINDSVIRISVGIEEIEDIIGAFEQALNRAKM